MRLSRLVAPLSQVARARALRCFVVLLVLAWGVPVTYALRFYLPFNPSRLASSAPSFMALIPEGWGFFTRDAREEDLFTYFKNDSDRWVLARQWTFGFGRSRRKSSIEAASILARIGTEAAECSDDHLSCLSSVVPGETIATTHPSPTLCGDIGFVIQKPVPWAWAAADVVMPSRFVRVIVTC